MRVETPAGTWHIRRRWAPRRLGADTIWARFTERTRSVRRRTVDGADVDPGCLVDLGEGIVAFLLVVVAVLFLIFIGIPLLVALGELIFVLVLALGGVVAKVLFRRPWTIDAVGPDRSHHTWQVTGWRRSSEARRYIATRVEASGVAPSMPEVAIAIGA